MANETKGSGPGEVRGDGGREKERRFEEYPGDGKRELDDLRGRVDELVERLRDFVRERPGTSIVVALGIGYLLGRVLRA